jgi:dihydrofolate reductase
MGRVITGLTVSVDGYIAGPDDGPGLPLGRGGERLFEWYFDGDTPSALFADFRLSPASAEFFDRLASGIGAIVTGRRTYDISRGWGGGGPMPGVPVFVLSHRPPPSTATDRQAFVADGIAAAIDAARAVAGERDVGLQGSAAVRQALAAGLLDVLTLHVVPVLLGGGVRLLDGVAADLSLLEVVDAPGVTHLRYEIVRGSTAPPAA